MPPQSPNRRRARPHIRCRPAHPAGKLKMPYLPVPTDIDHGGPGDSARGRLRLDFGATSCPCHMAQLPDWLLPLHGFCLTCLRVGLSIFWRRRFPSSERAAHDMSSSSADVASTLASRSLTSAPPSGVPESREADGGDRRVVCVCVCALQTTLPLADGFGRRVCARGAGCGSSGGGGRLSARAEDAGGKFLQAASRPRTSQDGAAATVPRDFEASDRRGRPRMFDAAAVVCS